MARMRQPLILTKANSRSTVHRPLYLDYIGVKRFDGGEVAGERRFLGLYTSAAADANPLEIPILRGKVRRVTRRAGYAHHSHNAKALARTLERYPRDELIQITDDELFAISMGIVAIGERERVGVFVRHDPYKRFVSCLVFLPRDRFNADNRDRIDRAPRDEFCANDIDSTVRLSDSKLARIHYIVRCRTNESDHDVAAIERRIAETTRPWADQLADALRDVHGEEHGNALLRRYWAAFPVAYRADCHARDAVADIDRAEALAAGRRLVVSVYQSGDTDAGSLRCKLLSPGERIALSDVLPILENMGLRVGDERPYELKPAGGARSGSTTSASCVDPTSTSDAGVARGAGRRVCGGLERRVGERPARRAGATCGLDRSRGVAGARAAEVPAPCRFEVQRPLHATGPDRPSGRRPSARRDLWRAA